MSKQNNDHSDEYLDRYIVAVCAAVNVHPIGNTDALVTVLNKLYSDGFEDGVNERAMTQESKDFLNSLLDWYLESSDGKEPANRKAALKAGKELQ